MALAEMIVVLPADAARLLERRGRNLADVTDLLDEWACLLNPVRAARDTAAGTCGSLEGWRATAKASVSASIARIARETAEDEGFLAAIAASPSLCKWVKDDKLIERALPVVLGFGVLASLKLSVGVQAASLRRKKEDERAAAAERRSASEASEQRPQLSSLPHDLAAADINQGVEHRAAPEAQ